MLRGALALALGLLCFAPAMAENELSIVQSSISIVRQEAGWLLSCYAEVRNDSAQVVALEEGHFSLTAQGGPLANGAVGSLMPYFLSPGQIGYLRDTVQIPPLEGDEQPLVTGLSYALTALPVDSALQSEGLSVRMERMERENGGLLVELRLQNTTASPIWNPTLAWGLYASGGALLYADGRTLGNIALPGGDETIVRFDVPAAYVDRWDEYGAEPAEVRAMASYGGDED